MATSVTFDYGSLQGPVIESPKADMKAFDYGSLNGPVVGLEAVVTGGQPTNLRGTTIPHLRQWHPRFVA